MTTQASKQKEPLHEDGFNALVVNASQEMAKEITLQLTLKIPGCSITYSPTIQLAKWILSRRKINLVVSSPVLADGSVEKLRDTLNTLEPPPDIVVVGRAGLQRTTLFTTSGYHCAAFRKISRPQESHSQVPQAMPAQPSKLQRAICNLGSDIRNDLNNPLQEIVAMVFVAKSGDTLANATNQALGAIENAAHNMAQVVKKIEEKIQSTVASAVLNK